MAIRVLFFLLCLLLGVLSIKGQSANEIIGNVDGKIVISFAAEQLSAELKYDYVATEDRPESVVFYLNEAFDVKKVTCRVCGSFNFDRQAKPEPSLVIRLKKPLTKGQRLPIKIEYNGSLKNIYKRLGKTLVQPARYCLCARNKASKRSKSRREAKPQREPAAHLRL